MSTLTYLALVLVLGASSGVARAEPPLAERSDDHIDGDTGPSEAARYDRVAHPWLVVGHLGMSTPFGELGVEVERAINEWLSLGAGGGVGLSGMSVGAISRASFGFGSFRAGVGLGASYGDTWISSDPGGGQRWSPALYGNGEIYLEHAVARWHFRGYLGGGYVLADAPSLIQGHSLDDGMSEPRLSPYVGLAVGYGF